MATVLRDVERPSFLDPPARPALSERLREERLTLVPATPGGRPRDLAGTRRGGEATLDELLVGAWEGLSAHRPVACPICAGSMAPRRQAAGGGCGDCGAQLR